MRAFLSNLLSLMVGNMFTLVSSFVLSLVMIQKLSAGEYGLQSAIVAFTSVVMSLAFMDIFNVTSRQLSGKRPDVQRTLYNSLFSLSLMLSFVACVIAGLVAWLLNSFPGPQFIVFLLGLITLVASYAPVAPTEAYLIVNGQMWRVAIVQSIYAAWTAFAGVLILLQGGGIGAMYVAFTLLSIVEIVVYMRAIFNLMPGSPRLVFRPREWKIYLRLATPGGLGSFFFISARTMGTYLVYTWVSPEHAGYLGISYLLVQATTLIAWVPYAVSILPVMMRLHRAEAGQFAWLSERSLTWLLAITLPIALGGMMLAAQIVGLLGKPEAVSTLSIFIWMVPAIVMAEFLYRMLLVTERQPIYLLATGIGALVNLVLCLVLIPRYGVEGAALSSVVSTTLIAGSCFWALRGWLFAQARWTDLLRIAVALAVMAVVVHLTAAFSVFIRSGLSALAYLAVAVLSELFSIADWNTARHVLAELPATSDQTPAAPLNPLP